MLKVRNLVVRYGARTVVHGVDLDVAAGEMVALIGPNGAGKTTCFNAINGQVPAHSGTVELAGETLLGLSPVRIWARGVGRSFQVTATFASMTVRENVQVGLLSHHGSRFAIGRATRDRHVEEADRLLEAVGMADQAERAAGVLAYGDLKRLELALALTNEPRLLLMDEPTAGMSPSERDALMRLAQSLTRERSIAVLVTDHDVDTTFRYADRVEVLHRGAIVASGDPAHVRADRQVREIYLGGSDSDAVPAETAR